MSNYTKTTDFEAKDSLPTGDSGKIIRGAEFETEFDAISTAIATKADTAGPTFTGTLTFETISDGTIGVTAFVDEDDMSSDSATLVPTQQSVKAYVDSQVTAQDLDFQADSGGALSIDLDSETLTFTGGTGIDTSGSGNAVTFAIDSTVATLTGTQTLTNKTLTSPDVNTPDIDGGTIDGTVIGGTTPAAVSATTVSATGNITVGGTVDGRDVAADGTKLDGIESGATADQTAAEIRTLVESATDSNVFTDADHTKLDGIEAGATGDQTNAEIRAAVEAATDSNVFTDADHSKLDGIEAGADVTDTANVTAAGALMDSEVTNLDQVKAFDSADYATAAQGSTADSALQNVVEDTTPQLGGDLASNGNDILFADNDKAIFGADSDMSLFHNGNNGFLDNDTGTLFIQTDALSVKNAAGTESVMLGAADGAVTLYHNNAAKLATTNTGIDVTGTVTADKTSITTVADFGLELDTGTAGDGILKIGHFSNGAFIGTYNDDGGVADVLRFGTHSGETRLRIDSNGDISFYEDTGTTAKLTWSAADERLGIGETSPISALHVNAGATNTVSTFESTNSTVVLPLIDSVGSTQIRSIDGAFAIRTGGDAGASTGTTEQLRIDTSGNVGIGTSSPSYLLHVNGGNQFNTGWIRANTGTAANPNFTIDGGAGMFKPTSNEVAFSTASTERMRIDSSGNVGINQSSPTRKLHVTSAGSGVVATFGDSLGNNTIEVTRTTTNASYIGLSATSAVGGIIAGPTFTFSTANSGGGSVTERMRLDSSGNLLVGTTTQSGKVTIDNGGSTTGLNVFQTSTATNYVPLNIHNDRVTGGNTAVMIRFQAGDNTDVGSIDSTVTATAYNTSSDQRLKENIVDAPSASDDIDAIQVRSFDWKADGSHQKYGMVAQELQSVAPEAVSVGETEEDMMGVDYSKLVPMMLKEIQSLRARVAQLEGAN